MENKDFTYLDVIYNVASDSGMNTFTRILRVLEESGVKNSIEAILDRYDFDSDVWNFISENIHLSMEFIERNRKRINWFLASRFQRLTEKVMHECKDMIVWYVASRYQKMSWRFIRDHEMLLDVECIKNNNFISECVKMKFEEFHLRRKISRFRRNFGKRNLISEYMKSSPF